MDGTSKDTSSDSKRVDALTKKIEYINRNTEILIAGQNFSESVIQVLSSVREYYDGDRVSLFEIDETHQFFNNTFESCAADVTPNISDLQKMPLAFLNSWTQQFNKHGFFLVDDINSCNDTDLYQGRSLRTLLQEHHIDSFFAVPIMETGRYLGFIGVDNFRARRDDVDFLITMGRYITIHMTKHRMDQDSRHMEDVLHNIPVAFILFKVDEAGGLEPYIYSQTLCHMLGGSEIECLDFYGRDGFSGICLEDRQRVKAFFRQHRYDKAMASVTYRILSLQHQYIWFRVTFLHVRVNNETYLYATYTDVDDIKKREEDLEKRYAAEQAFLDSVADRYLFTARANLTQDIIEGIGGTDIFSTAGVGMTYSQDVEILANHLLNEAQKKKYRQRFAREAVLQAYQDGEETLTEELCYIGDDKKLRWIKFQMNFVCRPESGDTIAFITEMDITWEKIVGTIMEKVVASQYDYVMCIRSDDKVASIIRVNQDDMDNVDSADIHDSDDYDQSVRDYAGKYLLPEGQRAFLDFMDLDRVWQTLNADQPYTHIFAFSSAGILRYKKLEFYCLDWESRLLVNVRTDYTDIYLAQVEQEEKLREALHQARQASLAKDEFLSRMSHDIRTPLNGIIGMTRLAKDANREPRIENYLDKINISSHFLLGLVNDILDMSKIAAGKLELHEEPYGEADFIKYVQSVITPLCESKGIHFHLPPPNLFNDRLMIDKLKYNQIFFNLLSNAVKFTPPGGNVTLDVRNPVVRNGRVEADFLISDDGIGMSDEFQQHLFQPFEQESIDKNSERTGTGLGLAIAKRLIDMMGGTIRVRSQIGRGSTFTLHFSFPIAQVVSKPEPAMRRIISLTGLHVLVAEDNDINGEIVVTLLHQRGAATVLVKNGLEAVCRFSDSPVGTFDAILMDVRMPLMDGIEATRQIRGLNRPDAMAVPIIATTANAYLDDVKRCLAAGMSGHVAKPIEPEVLFQVIHSQVQKKI